MSSLTLCFCFGLLNSLSDITLIALLSSCLFLLILTIINSSGFIFFCSSEKFLIFLIFFPLISNTKSFILRTPSQGPLSSIILIMGLSLFFNLIVSFSKEIPKQGIFDLSLLIVLISF